MARDASPVAITGSIATDHLMEFPGRFTESLVDGQLDSVSVSFLVDELKIRRGGVAANISFAMGRLGLNPVLVGAVGTDFDDYRSWLERHGVDTGSVHVSHDKHTARFICTTDQDQNQIASFYAGAMADARLIELEPVADRFDGLSMVLVAPNDPVAMVQHTRECRERGYRFIADPSQQLARMAGDEVRELIDDAAYLFTNEYETQLIIQKTGWSEADILQRVGRWVMTHGSKGVEVKAVGEPTVTVPAAVVTEQLDPTGVGDALRAGFLWATHMGFGPERACQAGCTLASLVLENVGTQEYDLDAQDFTDRIARSYGEHAAADIGSALTVSPAR